MDDMKLKKISNGGAKVPIAEQILKVIAQIYNAVKINDAVTL